MAADLEKDMATTADVEVARRPAAVVPFPARTIKAPVVEGALDPRFARELEQAAELANRSIAATTREKYAAAWRWFCTYCEQRGVPPLPAAPAVLAAWISSMVHNTDEVGTGLSTASIEHRVAAVNKAHKIAGYPPPGKHPEVELVLSGAIRTVGRRHKNRKRPLLVDELHELCQLMETVRLGDDTEVALGSLLGNKKVTDAGAGAGAGAIARVRAADVAISAVGIEVVLRPWRKRPVRVLIDATATGVVDAWRAVCADRPEWPLFQDRATVIRTARRISRLPSKPQTWPEMSPRHGALVVERLLDLPTGVVRDSAMILCGYSTAGRRSNLCTLVWDDCVLVEGRGVRVLFRKTKTDQKSEGTELWLPYGENEATCPVRAFERWRGRARKEAARQGVRLTGDHPVFVGVDRHGNGDWTEAISPEGFVHRLKMWAAAIGLRAEEIGGHTLRSGFVTSAVLAGLRLDEIQKVTGHKSIDMLMRYVREVEQWRHNPAASIGL